MAPSIKPFLMYQKADCEEAMNFYIDAFATGQILSMTKYGKDSEYPEGTVERATFELGTASGDTLTLMAIDSPPMHKFDFTPSSSLFVEVKDEAEFDGLIGKLAEGGEYLLPVDKYPWGQKFAWFNDRFGVSWQVNLA
ncbi:MAG: VOC family protein [Planctomycetota bacterium]